MKHKIVKALGIDSNELEAVRKEQIHVLPFLFGAGLHER